MHKGPSNSELDVLRKKLQESIYEIDELKLLVKKLSTENSALKSRYDPSVGDTFDVPL